jgi:hypothetical protein
LSFEDTRVRSSGGQAEGQVRLSASIVRRSKLDLRQKEIRNTEAGFATVILDPTHFSRTELDHCLVRRRVGYRNPYFRTEYTSLVDMKTREGPCETNVSSVVEDNR